LIRIASVSLYLCRSVSLSLCLSACLSLPSISLLCLSLFFSFSLSIYLSTNKKFPATEGAAHFLVDINFYRRDRKYDFYMYRRYLVEAVDVRIRKLGNFRLSQSSNVSMPGQLPRFEFVFRVFQDVGESEAHHRRVLNLFQS
jgi:hypothetical protein